MKIVIDAPFTEKELKEEIREAIQEDIRKGLLPFDTKIDAPLKNDNTRCKCD